jgi:hypothetical protein
MCDLKGTQKDKAAVKRQVSSVMYEDELLVGEHQARVAVTVVVGIDN